MVITTNISLWCINYTQARVHKSTQCTQYRPDVVQVYQNKPGPLQKVYAGGGIQCKRGGKPFYTTKNSCA